MLTTSGHNYLCTNSADVYHIFCEQQLTAVLCR